MINIRRYTPADADRWDDFVSNSRNGIFLHLRGYMDYHADRFSDFSLVAEDGCGRWIAILPACRKGEELSSHAGLTFGGWIMGRRAEVLSMLEVTAASLKFLRSEGIDTLYYKVTPYIYTNYPAEEDVYALLQCGAQLVRTMVASVVDLVHPIPFDMTYRQDVRRAQKEGVVINEALQESEWEDFWNLLTVHLKNRFDAAPVHTFDEIMLLRSRFPAQIRLYTALREGQLLGGVVVYHSAMAAHSQYTALSDQGRQLRVLPALHSLAMEEAKALGERYFDFGTSADDTPSGLNRGLIRQKIASGARGVLYSTYKISF